MFSVSSLGQVYAPLKKSLAPVVPHLLTDQLHLNSFLILELCLILFSTPWFGWKCSVSVYATQPILVHTGQSQHQSKASPAELSYLVLQLLDSHLEEDAYPGDSSPVMLQVHGPNVLTELLDERDNLIAVKLWADHLGPERDRIPGSLYYPVPSFQLRTTWEDNLSKELSRSGWPVGDCFNC